jgi:hypothetical protein
MGKLFVGEVFGGLVVLLLLFGGFIGWCLNLYKLALALSEPVTALLVLRALGVVFAPVGAVLGYV